MHAVLRFALSIAFALGATAPALAQDRVTLKDGSVLEGRVKSVGADRVVIDAGGIVVPLKRSEIAAVELAPDRSQPTEFAMTAPAAAPEPAKPAPKPAEDLAASAGSERRPLGLASRQPSDAESTAHAPALQVRLADVASDTDSGWRTLLQNRFGLDPNDPSKLLLYAALAFAMVTIVLALSARLADLYRRSPNRITAFSACTVLLVIPQIVWLPADFALIGCAVAADFVVWCLLVRWIFQERLLKSCVLLVGSAFIILLVALAGEVGRMMLAKGAAGSVGL